MRRNRGQLSAARPLKSAAANAIPEFVGFASIDSLDGLHNLVMTIILGRKPLIWTLETLSFPMGRFHPTSLNLEQSWLSPLALGPLLVALSMFFLQSIFGLFMIRHWEGQWNRLRLSKHGQTNQTVHFAQKTPSLLSYHTDPPSRGKFVKNDNPICVAYVFQAWITRKCCQLLRGVARLERVNSALWHGGS